MTDVQVMISIPGQWADRETLVRQIAEQSGGYLFAGQVIHHPERNVQFQVHIEDYNVHVSEAFNYASRNAFSPALQRDIINHTMTLYIIAPVNGVTGVQNLIHVGAALLNAGGLAVKVESAHAAYAKEDWLALVNTDEAFPIYSHFVTLAGDETFYYSCGMHAFGLPDVVIPASMSADEASDFLNNFNLYHLVERPVFEGGETFAWAEDSTAYHVHYVQDERFEDDDVLTNPFGVLVLQVLIERN